MTVASALWSFALLAGLLTIIPGLDTALVLRSSVTRSRAHAYATALGICTGALVWGAAAAVGAAALLAASDVAFMILKLAGAAYMVYLGISLIVGSFRRRETVQVSTTSNPRGYLASFGSGFLTNLLNPKVGVFYIALIPQFIPAGAFPLGMGLLLSLVHVLLSMIWFSGIILATQVARLWLTSPRVATWTDRTTGGMLIGFAALLAFESKPAG